jgi:hypothetical protein
MQGSIASIFFNLISVESNSSDLQCGALDGWITFWMFIHPSIITGFDKAIFDDPF